MATNKLTGAFVEIVKVTDPDGTATKTTLSFTTDDVEMTVDEDSATADGHADRRRIRSRTYNEAAVSLSSFIEPSMETLEEIGLIDPDNDGKLQFDAESRTWDACFLRVYKNEEDTDPALVHRYDEVEWHMPDGVTYPSDFATAGIEGWIHGDIFLDYTEA
ncbi:hypothetical protein [Natrinema sp. DC36]|uniref:hypothetical protein n=1 Tax=Natrinema sp. DC36 TaxID=2878680 RepID=UPI001CF0BFC5|nr:hypothetical protein [Natrinema sp. DC36]